MELVALVEVCPVQSLGPEACYMHSTFSLSYNENDSLSWSKKSPSRQAECTSPAATFHT
jgi:hypothetical protein